MRKALLLTVLVVAATAAAPAASEPESAAGELDLQVTFGLVSNLFPCPADVPPGASECRARTSTASVRGLGTVSLTYTWPLGVGPPTCAAEFAKALVANGRLSVAGKGEITFALAEAARCVPYAAFPQNEPQEFTITGGTGPFAGAAGRGTIALRSIGGGVGREIWTGTLVVPGFEFDVTPPAVTGAKPKTVRAPKGAKRVRVTYRVTARDDVDGELPVACRPRSGFRFRVGRTVVTCSAADTSANTRTARFRITVTGAR
jgi:HYR domain